MSGRVILVVDDEPADIETVKRVLTKAKVLNPVIAVSNGAEAISYLAGEGKFSDRKRFPLPVLLLLDLAMPHKSGLDVLEWIRNSPIRELRATGRIVLTGSWNLEQIRQAYLLGAHSFLVKPLRHEDFLNLLNAMRGLRLESDEHGHHLNFGNGA